MTGSARTRVALEVAREVSLGLLSVAAVLSLGRLFTGTDHLVPLLAHVVVAHVVVSACRRFGLHLALAATLTAAAGALTTAVVFYPATTTLGVPGPQTLRAVTDDVDLAWALFGEAPTPAEPITGFLVLCAAALWVAVFVADWAAFRLEVPLEAVLPAATVFVFSAVLADGRHRTPATVVAVAAAFAFLLVHRVSRDVRTGRWANPGLTTGTTAMLTAGGVLSALAVAAAALAGPSLPGAGAEAVVELEPSSDEPRSRVTVSPLVDIRRRLVDQADVEVFTVRSQTRSYWRLTSLDTFDGRIWSSSGSYGEADGGLPSAGASPRDAEQVTQEYSIRALAAIWLPAAFEPRRVDSEVEVRYDPTSATLIVDTDIDDSDGVQYSVTSELPRFSPEELQSSDGAIPPEVREANLQVPPSVPDTVAALAQQVAGAATTPYARALALQDFFRSEFEYSLEVPSGHDGDDLERFLTVERAGYCEQFAGAYAAMARILGLPTRVAVGFTPGVELEPGLFEVRGENAHAWPEVYLAGSGWVPFEPTPGRGAPFAESYTGVPEQQEVGGQVTRPEDTGAAEPEDDPAGTAQPDPTAGEQDPGGQTPAEPAGAGDEEGSGGAPGWLTRAVVLLAALAVLAVTYVAVVLSIHHLRRRRRRRGAGTARQRVELAWDQSVTDAGLLGLLEDPSATHDETARIVAGLLPDQRDVTRELAQLAELATYAEGGVGDEQARAAEAGAARIAVAVRDRATLPRRARQLLDPRPLLPHGVRRRIGSG